MNNFFHPTFRDLTAGYFFASDCLLCGERLADTSPVCPACFGSLRPAPYTACRKCGQEISPSLPDDVCLKCRERHFPYSEVRSAGFYTEKMQKLIHALKFEKRWSVTRILADLTAGSVGAEYFKIDCIVPIPLHPRRLRERGFNQSALFAGYLGRRFGVKVDEGCLKRVRNTRPQAVLDHVEREKNISGAFRLTRHADIYAGRRILLVDDVMTTGQTVRAAAEELKKIRPVEIRVLAAVRAG